MRQPIPLTDIYPADYITAHLEEMNSILVGRRVVLDNSADDFRINSKDTFTIVNVRQDGVTITDHNESGKRYGCRRISLVEITSLELERLIENTKRKIRLTELDIEKYQSWKEYMQENKLRSLDVLETNRMLLLSMMKQVSGTSMPVDEMKLLLSKVLDSE